MNSTTSPLTPFAKKRLECVHPTEWFYWSFDELICHVCGTVIERDEV
jgi:hypothetical protein